MAASSEGVAVSIGDASGQDEDRLNEGPWAGDQSAKSKGEHGDEELCNPHTFLSEVEVVDAKHAKEETEDALNHSPAQAPTSSMLSLLCLSRY